jgi:hypothetical protein
VKTTVVKRREISGLSKKGEGRKASLRWKISKPTLDGEAQAAKASWVARLLERNRGTTETIKKEAGDTPHHYEVYLFSFADSLFPFL